MMRTSGHPFRMVPRGQSTVEYSLLLALLIVTVTLSLAALGIRVQEILCLVLRPFGVDACATSFYDTFDSLSAWVIDRGHWSVRDGELCGGPGEGRIFKDLEDGDYTITLDGATLARGNGYGVYFRVSEVPAFNGYSFQYDPGYRAFIFRKWVHGHEIAPPFAVARARDYDWYGEPHQIQVVANGNQFTALVDGTPVLSASDDTYTSGGIGLRTWDGTRACFDSIAVNP